MIALIGLDMLLFFVLCGGIALIIWSLSGRGKKRRGVK
jgi:hypothetical protein